MKNSFVSLGKCPNTGKVKFQSRGDAKIERRHMKTTEGFRYDLSVFKCEFCGYFHVGGKRVNGVVVTRETHKQIQLKTKTK